MKWNMIMIETVHILCLVITLAIAQFGVTVNGWLGEQGIAGAGA